MIAKFLTVLTLLGASLASPVVERQAACTDEYRAAQLDGVAPAFSDQTPGATARFLQQLPLKPDAKLLLYINGAPPITIAPDASTTRNFALGVRQIFYRVYPTIDPSTINSPNGTSHTELEIELGPRVIALPVNIHADMNFNYDLADCKIKTLDGFLTIPSAVFGIPVNQAAAVAELLAAGNAGRMPAL
ncbi:hypothetical protein CB0940_07202 [Cercospora beticola]|uniref:Uncharacterized protein n=1 Tax=Cercospora beticola TaxID=122368 RepID=A0A2G5HAU8_CERBT|nr:hypothetical protein CB0940_07202 [Cercospora beticola]PIA89676.1 hypothetical protein CB0940_07202 [Cercospora beticola]WPB03130.1 hypothetical protein RHO25_007767 [Cercospora beticola]